MTTKKTTLAFVVFVLNRTPLPLGLVRRSLSVDVIHMVMVAPLHMLTTMVVAPLHMLTKEDALHMLTTMVMALLLLVARVKGHFTPYGAFIHVTDS